MKDKKGVIALQFNWIFVLIIGAIILTFFIVVVNKQREFSKETVAETIQTDLQAIFSSSYVSTGTASIVELPQTEIRFDCDGDTPGFRLGRQAPARFPYAFAPDLIKSQRSTLSIYTTDWSVPYRVTNFLYVTSPDVMYVVKETSSGDSEYAYRHPLEISLMDALPPRYITKDGEQRLFFNKIHATLISGILNVPDMNHYKIRVIMVHPCDSFNVIPGSQFRYANEGDISALCINRTSCGSEGYPTDCFGKLQFYNYDGSVWNEDVSYFVGWASLLAAIYSEDRDSYECGMKNAFEKMEVVSDLYSGKVDSLDTGSCDYTSNIGGFIQGIGNKAGSLANDMSVAASYIEIFTKAHELDLANDVMVGGSCPAVY